MESLDASSLRAFAEPLAQLEGDEKTGYASLASAALRSATGKYEYTGGISTSRGSASEYYALKSRRVSKSVSAPMQSWITLGMSELLSTFAGEYPADRLSVSMNSGFPIFSDVSGTSKYAGNGAPGRLKELPSELVITEKAIEKVFSGEFPETERNTLMERKYMEKLVSLSGKDIADSKLYISPPKIGISRIYNSSDKDSIALFLTGFNVGIGMFSTYTICFDQEKPSRFKKPPAYREDESSLLSKIPLPGKSTDRKLGDWTLSQDFESRVKSYFSMKPVDVIDNLQTVGKITGPVFADRTVYGPFIWEKNASSHKPFEELVKSQENGFIFQIFCDSIEWDNDNKKANETHIRHLFCAKGMGEGLAKIVEEDKASVSSDIKIEYAIIEV